MESYHLCGMERIIRVRSLLIDRDEQSLTALGRAKEEELRKCGLIASPLFKAVCIAPMLQEQRLGYFSPSDLLIVISEEITRSSEETMRNIFLHELAHALDYYLHGVLSGHGALFRECCAAVGVDPGFEKNHVRTSLVKNNEKKNRIRKLLALSSSPFENEAAEAIRKAKALMARDGITLDERQDRKIYMVPMYQAKRFPFFIRMLLSYISDTTGVYIVISQDERAKTAVAYGSLEETEASIYLYDYLIGEMEREIRERRRNGEHISKDSFISGAIAELSRKTSDTVSDTALTAIKAENRKMAKEIIFPDVKLRRRSAVSHGGDAESYAKGLGFGTTLSIPMSIGHKALE